MIAAIAERFFLSATAAITAIVAVIWKPGLIVVTVCEDNSQIQSLSEELMFAFRIIIKILFGRGGGGGSRKVRKVLSFFFLHYLLDALVHVFYQTILVPVTFKIICTLQNDEALKCG